MQWVCSAQAQPRAAHGCGWVSSPRIPGSWYYLAVGQGSRGTRFPRRLCLFVRAVRAPAGARAQCSPLLVVGGSGRALLMVPNHRSRGMGSGFGGVRAGQRAPARCTGAETSLALERGGTASSYIRRPQDPSPMHNSHPNLHDALRAVVRSNVPHLRSTSCRTEHWLVTLLARRARQLAASGHCREEIVTRLIDELAGPDPSPAPKIQCPGSLMQILRRISAPFRR